MNAKSNTLANQIYQHTLAICEGAASHLLLYYWSTQIKVLPPHALRTGNLWGQVGRKIVVSITSKCLWRTEFWLRNCSELSSELSSNNEILGETKANSLIPTFWGNSVFDEQYSTIQDWLLAITTGTRVLVVGTPMACNTCSRVLAGMSWGEVKVKLLRRDANIGFFAWAGAGWSRQYTESSHHY